MKIKGKASTLKLDKRKKGGNKDQVSTVSTQEGKLSGGPMSQPTYQPCAGSKGNQKPRLFGRTTEQREPVPSHQRQRSGKKARL